MFTFNKTFPHLVRLLSPRIRLVSITLLLPNLLSSSAAEVTCAATITYHWTKEGETTHANEIHSVVLSHGSSEPEAKAQLSIKTRRAQAEALSFCRQEHETVSSCISKRFRQAGDVVRNSSLATRRALETSISTECSNRVGRCISTDTSQPECRAVEATPSAQPSPEAQGTAAGGKAKSGAK